MIAKGISGAHSTGLARYFEQQGENAWTAITSSRGVVSETPRGAIAEMDAMAAGTQHGAQHLYHAILRPHASDRSLSAEEWDRAWQLYEEALGLEGQPYIEASHAKPDADGRTDVHVHRVYSRVDQESGQIIRKGFDRIAGEVATRRMEYEFGHAFTPDPKNDQAVLTQLDRQGHAAEAAWMREGIATLKAEGRYQLQGDASATPQARPITTTQAAQDVTRAWERSDSATAFAAALRGHGYTLARGDRGAIVVVDGERNSRSLARLLNAADRAENAQGQRQGVKAFRQAVDARFGEAERAQLPHVDDVPAPEATASAEAGLERDGAPADAAEPGDDAGEAAGTAPDAETSTTATTATAGEAASEAAPASHDSHTWALVLRDEAVRESTVVSEDALWRRLYAGTRDEDRATALLEQVRGADDTVRVPGGGDEGAAGYITTQAVAQREAELIERADRMTRERRYAAPTDAVERHLADYARRFREATGHELADEQREAVRDATAGADLFVVRGVAGAGKSTALEAAREIHEAQGQRVIGAALSGKAAENLADTGIDSTTLHKLENRLATEDSFAALQDSGEIDARVRRSLATSARMAAEKGEEAAFSERMTERAREIEGARHLDDLSAETRQWAEAKAHQRAAHAVGPNTVAVIDEAGMLGHDQLARVTRQLEERGAKIGLVGDEEQLQPMQAGAAFRVMADRAGSAQISTVVRQREAWQRQASEDLASGDPARVKRGVRAYGDDGRVVAGVRGLDTSLDIAEAEEKLGRELEDADRQRVDTVVRYVEARQVAGRSWHELGRANAPAREQRDEAALAITQDPQGYAPWLARYGIAPETVATDALRAQGESYEDAQAQAGEHARQLGLHREEPDVRLRADTLYGARQRLLADYGEHIRTHGQAGVASTFMVAATNRDVRRLNAGAREQMRAAGHLSSPDHEIDTAHGRAAFAVGDRVMGTRNDRASAMTNGALGTVTDIQPGAASTQLTVRLDTTGQEVTLDTQRYAHLTHGYAGTVHKGQGATFDTTFVLDHPREDRHMAYTALTRHKGGSHVYTGAAVAQSVDGLADRMAQGASKGAVRDHVSPHRVVERPETADQAGQRIKAARQATATRASVGQQWARAWASEQQTRRSEWNAYAGRAEDRRALYRDYRQHRQAQMAERRRLMARERTRAGREWERYRQRASSRMRRAARGRGVIGAVFRQTAKAQLDARRGRLKADQAKRRERIKAKTQVGSFEAYVEERARRGDARAQRVRDANTPRDAASLREQQTQRWASRLGSLPRIADALRFERQGQKVREGVMSAGQRVRDAAREGGAQAMRAGGQVVKAAALAIPHALTEEFMGKAEADRQFNKAMGSNQGGSASSKEINQIREEIAELRKEVRQASHTIAVPVEARFQRLEAMQEQLEKAIGQGDHAQARDLKRDLQAQAKEIQTHPAAQQMAQQRGVEKTLEKHASIKAGSRMRPK